MAAAPTGVPQEEASSFSLVLGGEVDDEEETTFEASDGSRSSIPASLKHRAIIIQ